MGQTIAGGYYKGINGKFHDANGNEVEEQSAAAIKKAQDAEVEVEGAVTATDPGPLGPVNAPQGEESSKRAEESAKKPGTPGGRKAPK